MDHQNTIICLIAARNEAEAVALYGPHMDGYVGDTYARWCEARYRAPHLIDAYNKAEDALFKAQRGTKYEGASL
jgi:hypothetical protein